MNGQTLAKHLVMYVDDDRDDIHLMQEALERYPNVELISFTDSCKFLNYIIESKPFKRLPSLILIDINMPVLDGRNLLTMLRSYEELKKVKMVLYTTSSNPADDQFAKTLEAGFLTKPVSVTQLNQTMQQLLMECQFIFG
jgi:CheY-like chemotaxis protein